MRGAVAAWRRFFFAPQPTSTLALVRIAAGLLSFFWTLALAPDLQTFFSPDGVFPDQPGGQGSGVWGVLDVFPGQGALIAVYVILLLASLALTLGLGSRVAAVLVLVG